MLGIFGSSGGCIGLAYSSVGNNVHWQQAERADGTNNPKRTCNLSTHRIIGLCETTLVASATNSLPLALPESSSFQTIKGSPSINSVLEEPMKDIEVRTDCLPRPSTPR